MQGLEARVRCEESRIGVVRRGDVSRRGEELTQGNGK
jgi:hypothetical protein